MKSARRSAILPIRWLLSFPGVRRRLAFAITQDYFADLHLRMPLEYGFSAPLDHYDAILAFSETFLSNEYGDLFHRLPLPTRWLDFGCHRGYFSLWLACEKARRGLSEANAALLIDADPRAQTWFNNLKALNQNVPGFQFLHAAVSTPDAGEQITFAQRDGMGSVRPGDLPVECDHLITVPRLRSADITARLAPPYDLIKVDIEGAEYALLETMGDVLSQASYLVVEWHGWNEGAATSEARLIKAAAALGFGPPELLRPNRDVPTPGITFVTGTHLYRKKV